jgi:hypothetical protein
MIFRCKAGPGIAEVGPWRSDTTEDPTDAKAQVLFSEICAVLFDALVLLYHQVH